MSKQIKENEAIRTCSMHEKEQKSTQNSRRDYERKRSHERSECKWEDNIKIRFEVSTKVEMWMVV